MVKVESAALEIIEERKIKHSTPKSFFIIIYLKSCYLNLLFNWLIVRLRPLAYQTISIIIALAPPPPLQIAAAPIFPLFCFNTFISVTIIRAPLQPNG